MSEESRKISRNKTAKDSFYKGVNLSNYILLPSHDIYIAKERTLQGKNWFDAHEELHKQNARMLTLKEFAEFLKLLKSGKAFDGTKNKVDSRELETIIKEIIEFRNPYRSEWLDNRYSKKGGILEIRSKLSVTYHKFDSSGKLVEVTEQLDPDTLMEDKIPGISLGDWIENPTPQGLPKSNTKDGKLYYWQPTEGSVVRFNADAGRVVLNCDRDPASSYPALGVRAAKIFKS